MPKSTKLGFLASFKIIIKLEIIIMKAKGILGESKANGKNQGVVSYGK